MKVMKFLYWLIIALVCLLVLSVIRHQLSLRSEAKLRDPMGQLIEVDGHNMSVYQTGSGDHTLVFLSGGGTCSPILDYKSK